MGNFISNFFEHGQVPGNESDKNPIAHQVQGKSGGKMPDYAGASDKQTAADRPDQIGPNGSVQWTKDANGNWTQNTSLAPGLAGANAGIQGQIAGQGPIGNGDAARDQAITGAYNQATSRLNPRFAQEDQLMQSQLANQGLDPSSAAYRNSMQQYGQGKNDAYTSAMASAIGQGTAAQQATFGENYAAHMAPYQELGSLQGLATGQPGFMGSSYLPGTVAQGNYQLGAAGAQNQFWGDVSSGIGQATSAGFAASDERVKDDVTRLPFEAAPGVPLATFSYKGVPQLKHLGVIAQDVEKVMPGAVATGPGGVKQVDYSQLGFAPKTFAADPSAVATPEERQQLTSLSTIPDKQHLLEQQLEQAQSLATHYAGQHHTSIGAAFGSIADIINGQNLKKQKEGIQGDQDYLLEQQQKGRDLYGSLMDRLRLQQLQAQQLQRPGQQSQDVTPAYPLDEE